MTELRRKMTRLSGDMQYVRVSWRRAAARRRDREHLDLIALNGVECTPLAGALSATSGEQDYLTLCQNVFNMIHMRTRGDFM